MSARKPTLPPRAPNPSPNLPPDERAPRADRWLIIAAAGLRAVAIGFAGVIFALYLLTLGLNAWAIGVAVSLGLAGCALGTALVIWITDRLGRRATLLWLSLAMALGGAALAMTTSRPLILLSVLFGMVNGMGRDRGAGLTIEQAMLPQTTTASHRTRVFAWYNLVIDGGHAVGALLGGLPAWLRAQMELTPLASYQASWWIYSGFCVAAAGLACRLSPAVEWPQTPSTRSRLSPASQRTVARFAALSGLDSLGGGFLTTAFLSYWFFRRFGVDEAVLGPLFFLVRMLNGVSHLGAAWLAQRIGLVRTMVWTHVPSSLLLLTVPIAPNLPVAILLFVIRESLVEMDVPTRQSYLVAIVPPEDRVRAAGITNLTRSAAWAAAPLLGGSLAQSVALSAPLILGASIKIVYDALLYRAFRHVRPPEEREG
jgi:MFS family permease